MRLIDLSIVVMAVASLLFPSPVGNLGVAYKVAAVVLGIASLSRLNWQVLPALSVLAARFVFAEYLQIRMSLLTTIFVKLVGMLALAVSGTLLLLLPIPSFPSLWDRPVCTQELFITRRSRHSSETRSIRLRVWAPMDPASQLASGLKKASYVSRFGMEAVLKAGFGGRVPAMFGSHITLAQSNSIGTSSQSTSKPAPSSSTPAALNLRSSVDSDKDGILSASSSPHQRSSPSSPSGTKSSTRNGQQQRETPPNTVRIGLTRSGTRKSASTLFATPPLATPATAWPPGSPMGTSANPNAPPTQALDPNSAELANMISHDHARWPLVLFSHGLTGTPEIYTTYGEQLASLGFIVIAPAHTDGSCAESYVPHADDAWEERNTQVNERVADLRSILDTLQSLSHRPNFHPTAESPRGTHDPSLPSSSYASRSSFSAYVQSPDASQPVDPETEQILGSLRALSERIDFTRVGVCGHSFGGATAVQTLQQDSRVVAGVSWDGWMYPLAPPTTPIHQSKPFLFINSDGFQWEENVSYMRQWSSHSAAGGHIVTMKQTSHHNFNDLPFYAHPFLTRWIANNSRGWFGRADPTQTTQLAVALAAAFNKRAFCRDDPATPSILRTTIRDCVLAHTSKVLVDYIPNGGLR